MLVGLADRIPKRYVTPATAIANAEMSVVLNLAVDYYNQDGPDGLEAACQKWLEMSAADLRKRMDQWRFPAEGSTGVPPVSGSAGHGRDARATTGETQ